VAISSSAADRRQPDADACGGLPRRLPAPARGDMADLVPQHTRQPSLSK
jgi:hypothetical protein